MNVWPRAVALAVAVVAAALLLKLAPPVVVLLLFVAGIAVAFLAVRRARERERRPSVELLGLTPAADEEASILASPLSLFGRVSDPAPNDLLRGRRRSLDVRVFTLSFRPPVVPASAGERIPFACAMGIVDADWPGLVVEPQAFLVSLGEPGPGLRLSTGDTELDDAWTAWTDDEAFALQALNVSTRAWLRSLDRSWGVEIRGGLALVYGPAIGRPDPAISLEVLSELLEHVPTDLGAAHPPAG